LHHQVKLGQEVKAEGELLWPQREGRAELDGAKRRLGSYGYASQYNQSPIARGGNLFKAQWLGTVSTCSDYPRASAVAGQLQADLGQEFGEFPLVHFARRHRKLSVLRPAQTADVASDRDVVGRISKYHRRLLALQQCRVGGLIERAAAV
jgi:hypothetical protein